MGKKTQRRKGAKAQRKPGIGFSSLRPCVFAFFFFFFFFF
jgi:hypothetical protein